MDPLYYELVHNLVMEVTRLGIEVHNMKMRVESLASRLDFDERRGRSLESVVEYRQPSPSRRPQAPAESAAPARRARSVGAEPAAGERRRTSGAARREWPPAGRPAGRGTAGRAPCRGRELRGCACRRRTARCRRRAPATPPAPPPAPGTDLRRPARTGRTGGGGRWRPMTRATARRAPTPAPGRTRAAMSRRRRPASRRRRSARESEPDEQRLRPPRRASLRAEARQRAGVGPREQLMLMAEAPAAGRTPISEDRGRCPALRRGHQRRRRTARAVHRRAARAPCGTGGPDDLRHGLHHLAQ